VTAGILVTTLADPGSLGTSSQTAAVRSNEQVANTLGTIVNNFVKKEDFDRKYGNLCTALLMIVGLLLYYLPSIHNV
jgi:hypothetical protein